MCFIAKAAIRSLPLLLPECHLKRLGFRAIASADPVGDIIIRSDGERSTTKDLVGPHRSQRYP